MELAHDRFKTASDSTVSRFRIADEGGQSLGILIEDQYQDGEKVPGETCIPTGRYRITLRTDSPKFAHYYDRWDWYRGVPWIRDVPNFSYVYYHPGTDDDDSEGCPLTGLDYVETEAGEFEVMGGTSRAAFKALCLVIYAEMDRGEEVWTTITDAELWE